MSWIIFPNQLFKSFFSVPKSTILCLLEEPLYFSDESRSTTFAKIKLAYTRATMKSFEASLRDEGFTNLHYISYTELKNQNFEQLLKHISSEFKYYDVCDHLLEKKLNRFSGVKLEKVPDSPMFLYTHNDLENYMKESKSNPFFQTSFYRYFRIRTGALINKDGSFKGGKLSFDNENRSRMPAKTSIPKTLLEINKEVWEEALNYVDKYFPNNPGSLDFKESYKGFALTHKDAERHLKMFIKERLDLFGPYQDTFLDLRKHPATNSGTLFHSCISPYINNGLLSAQHVLDTVLEKSSKARIQSLEGFIRQLMGWREFIRLVYLYKGEEMRQSNQLNNYKALGESWYNGSTGIPPVDDSIQYAFKHGYLHHILRLMVVANFMNLARVHPHEMYRWFLDFALDAYDWVMVGNVYGMASFSTSVMSTKPYISGSNYVLKMSDYDKGKWCDTWNGLYYKFLKDNQKLFEKNPRMGLMLANLNKKGPEEKSQLFLNADEYLTRLPNFKKRAIA